MKMGETRCISIPPGSVHCLQPTKKSRCVTGVQTGLANMPNTSMTLCSECLIGMERRWLSRLHGDELIERLAGLTD